MARQTRSALLVLAACLMVAIPAAGKPAPRPAPAQQSKTSESTQQALELADQYMAEGDHAAAAKLLIASYDIDPDPQLLYKLAGAYEGQKGREALEGAIDAYRRFLESKPDEETEALVVERVAQLEEQLAELDEEKARKEEEKAETRAAQQAEGPDFIHGGWPWVIASVGAASLAATGLFGALAIVEHNRAEGDPVQREAAERQERAETFAIVTNATLVAGILLTGAGVTFISLGYAIPQYEEEAELRIGPGGASLRLGF